MTDITELVNTMDYGTAPEDDTQARAWLASHPDGFGHFINGQFTKPDTENRIEVFDPATETTLTTVSNGTPADVDQAVRAARAAFPKWSKLSGHQRARYLYALARHIQKRARLLAILETIDNGKTIRESRDIDIPLVARHFYHHAGWAQLLDSEFSGYGPVGVCGQIIPWNFPLLMLSWKIAPALAAGNTVVLKPAELTPLTAIAFAQICVEIGLPKGVVNIVQGDGSTGAAICDHRDVDKLAFTGSTEVGRMIRKKTAGSGKKLSLELGGKSPFLVFDDADMDAAIEGVVDAIWFNQGEVCCAGSRILLHESIAGVFTQKLKTRMEKLRIGNPLDKSMDMGSVVSAGQASVINSLLDKGRAEGANLHQSSATLPNKGSFVRPGFFTDAQPASTISQEEIFGPIGVVTTFRSPTEALALANNSRYGLSASIWSENINLALDIAAGVKAGIVWINGTNMFDAAAGFGGYRESGFGREGGREGLYEYLVADWEKALTVANDPPQAGLTTSPQMHNEVNSAIDKTAKLFVGGKQVRPDGGQSYAVFNAKGAAIAAAGLGNRKDIRNAVAAAEKSNGWARLSGHARAQVLYFLAENLSTRQQEFETLLRNGTDATPKQAAAEVNGSVDRIFYYAAQADKYDGAVHHTQSRHVTLAMNEPWGVMGLVCPDEMPLLSFISLVLPAIALGNRIIAVASQSHPLLATNFYQVLETSDMPDGVVNIVTGNRDDLAKTLAQHDAVNALWYMGSPTGSAMVETQSGGNLKATWVNNGKARNWLDPTQGQGREYLRRACQVKNIWVPYGI